MSMIVQIAYIMILSLTRIIYSEETGADILLYKMDKEKMMRLIDADALKYQMLFWYDRMRNTGSEAQGIFKTEIDNAPTIDAESVVRCKDCKYCSVDRYADGNVPDYACIEMDCGVEADDFCSRGERKDNE